MALCSGGRKREEKENTINNVALPAALIFLTPHLSSFPSCPPLISVCEFVSIPCFFLHCKYDVVASSHVPQNMNGESVLTGPQSETLGWSYQTVRVGIEALSWPPVSMQRGFKSMLHHVPSSLCPSFQIPCAGWPPCLVHHVLCMDTLREVLWERKLKNKPKITVK